VHKPLTNQPFSQSDSDAHVALEHQQHVIQLPTISQNHTFDPFPAALSSSEHRLPDNSHIVKYPSQSHQDDGQLLANSLFSEKLKGMIRTLVLDIAGNAEKRPLVSKLQDDDAQCMVDYLDQVLS
jgi:hypothetical protein